MPDGGVGERIKHDPMQALRRPSLDAAHPLAHLAVLMAPKDYPQTPDGRYFVASGKLWRCSDPRLTPAGRKALTSNLMAARRKVKEVQNNEAKLRAARRQVNAAKEALGERGPVWWDDGAPDETMTAPQDSSYADWWAGLSDEERKKGYAGPKKKG